MRPNDAMPQKFPEFPGALQELPGPPGVRSQKVQRVILSIPSALPSEGKLEKVQEHLIKLEEIQECMKNS